MNGLNSAWCEAFGGDGLWMRGGAIAGLVDEGQATNGSEGFGGAVAVDASSSTASERSSHEPEANESTEELRSSGVSEREFLMNLFASGGRASAASAILPQ